MASLKKAVKNIGDNIFNFGIPDYDTLMKRYTPAPVKESREYRHFRKKVLPRRIRRLIGNYKSDPDNFEISSIEIVYREIDAVTTREMHHIHNELTRQLNELRNSISEILSGTYEMTNEVTLVMQELENRYLELQEYLTEYRRPVITDEIEEENLLPDNEHPVTDSNND